MTAEWFCNAPVRALNGNGCRRDAWERGTALSGRGRPAKIRPDNVAKFFSAITLTVFIGRTSVVLFCQTRAIGIHVNKNGQASEQVDQELVLRVQQGDKRAFDILVRKYQHKIVQLIFRYTKDQNEALDVAQESFIKAYRALPKFRGDSAFYTWLYRIAINTAKNHLVARSRRAADSEIDAQDAEQYEHAVRLKDQDTPEHILLSEEIAQTITAAIDELPEELRVAISLREFEGMSYEEIATTMDCPVGTVRSRIFRAREAIDKKLNPLLDKR